MIVDIHSHLYPRAYIDLLKNRSQIPLVVTKGHVEEFVIFPEEHGPDGVGGRAIGREFWDVELKLQFMDSFGIHKSVVSLGNPWMEPFGTDEGEAATEAINKTFARYEEQTGGRIVGMGVLPSSSVDAAIRGIDRITSAKGLRGIVTGPRLAGCQFDDRELDDFWERLEGSGLPFFVHPQDGIAPGEMEGYRHVLPVGLGFPMETTLAMSRLVLGGVLERYPGLKIVVAHGGGCLPYLAGRLDAAWRSDIAVKDLLPMAPSNYLGRLYLDALVYDQGPLHAANFLTGTEKIFFGTDHPFSVSDPSANLGALEAAFPEEDRNLILGQSASRLFLLNA